VHVYTNGEEGKTVREFDSEGNASKSTVVPANFLASAATADGRLVWGRTVNKDRLATQIAFFDTQGTGSVVTVGEKEWHTVEPIVSAFGDVAFCRIVSREGAQHLCVASKGKVHTIHERLVPGGGRFSWSHSGKELISIVIDQDGGERLRIDAMQDLGK
jgi:hypothetical protein